MSNTICTKCILPVNKPYFYNRDGELVCFDCLMADKPEVTVLEVKRPYIPGTAWNWNSEPGFDKNKNRKRR